MCGVQIYNIWKEQYLLDTKKGRLTKTKKYTTFGNKFIRTSTLAILYTTWHKISNVCHCTGGRIEAPRGWGVGGHPSPLGVGSGEGAVPSIQKIFWISDIKMVSFCAFLGGIIYRLAACFARKKWCLWSSKLKLTAACRTQRWRETETEREERQSRNKNLSKVQIILH